MSYYALTFLVIALIAGVMGFTNVENATAQNIAWILFVVGLVLAVVFFVRGRGDYVECSGCRATRKERARRRFCETCRKEF